MLLIIIKRTAQFIPSFLLLIILGFILLHSAPGNPVDSKLNEQFDHSGKIQAESQLIKQRKAWGLDLPLFYFSINSWSMPDTLHRIIMPAERNTLKLLVRQYGNWPLISDWYQHIKQWKRYCLQNIPAGNDINFIQWQQSFALIDALSNLHHAGEIHNTFHSLNLLIKPSAYDANMQSNLHEAQQLFNRIESQRSVWKNYIPAIRFHFPNQFHRWLVGNNNGYRGIIRGDLGKSYTTGKPVFEQISGKMSWSAALVLFAVCMAYAVSIPLAMLSFRFHNRIVDHLISIGLLILYAIPTFLGSILLLTLFSNPDMLNWFPTGGLGPPGGFPENKNIFYIFVHSISYWILPVLAYAYGSLAFLTRTLRASLLTESSHNYAITAHAKGLTKFQVIQKHLLPNSLLPLITIFSSVFPAAVGGSVMVETIFSLPGMGRESLQAVYRLDYPVLIAILMVTALLTMAGYLISDILYAIADPRIRHANKLHA